MEENKTPISQPQKTEIVSAIPVKEPAGGASQTLLPNPPSVSIKSSNQKQPNALKPNLPKNRHLGIVIATACIVAAGLSVAAVMAFRRTL